MLHESYFSDAYLTPIIVPTMLKAFVSSIPTMLAHVDAITCVSLSVNKAPVKKILCFFF